MPHNDAELFTSILGSVSDYIYNRDLDVMHYFVAGDFNCSLGNSDSACVSLKCFLQSCNLVNAMNDVLDPSIVTYKHSSLNHSSLIDYIFVSRSLLNYSICATVQDSGINMSDHIPVVINIKFNWTVGAESEGASKLGKVCSKEKHLRWDKANFASYYECMHFNLYPVYIELCNYYNICNISNHIVIIQELYHKIVNALLISDVVVPRTTSTHFKHWWNSSLDLLKNKSIESFKLWQSVGKPSYGDIYQKMRSAKTEYKTALNGFRAEGEKIFSENLYDNLMDKNMDGFWSSWKSKFGKKSSFSKIVEGSNNNEDIARTFKNFFSKTCTPNNVPKHEMHKQKFFAEFDKYSCYEDCNNLFSVENIENALLRLKCGKAAGFDNLSAEHLIYAHPCLIISLKMLFNLMFMFGFVPDDFRNGVLIPLLKDVKEDASLCDNYRGITLSCIVSKVFEYVLLDKYGSLLVTDNLQFGFRNGIGCSDALYTVKSVIDYFVKNGCTLTISALDVSKAFDRISYYALFSKLMLKGFPKQFINILLSWYNKSFIKVKWIDKLSDSFQALAGVRQGGVLSPFLFAIYIEDVLKELKLSGKGCKIHGVYLGCFLYADDILLLSQSVTCLQSMLEIISVVLCELDLMLNAKKSGVMRIGRRFDLQCSKLMFNHQVIPFVDEIKYLGVFITRGPKFNRSISSSKIKFYRCFNSVYNKASFASE